MVVDCGTEAYIGEAKKVRKLKKLSNSETVFKNFKSEVEKSGKNINEVLKECVVNSWGGFKAEWILNNTSTQNKNLAAARTIFGDERTLLDVKSIT